LLIGDEEQRFGVEQKERLKELKNNVDVLTLSATPIPRTLQISLLGVRALSKIDTPPSDRMPIQTYVSPFRWDAVKELIERELGREGQVFYLHNNIGTLYQCAAKLQSMLPNVRIACAHGKLPRNEVEDIMMNFYNGNIDVLVCTSIIENGIDVPNANMIIVEDSENYGLSQLYQIKGRVGRSNRIAYAYLFYNEHRIMKEKTEKRLRAIQEFTELGSGYKIAQRDLLIRGAGDILGPEQAGYIDSIGLDMYIKLLNEAVQEKMSGEKVEEKPQESLLLNVFVPNEYVSEGNKIELYQEVLTAPDHETLAKIKLRTRDVYGKLPQQAEILFAKRSIELLLRESKVKMINETPKNYHLILGKEFLKIKGVGNILFEVMIPFLQIIKISVVDGTLKIAVTKRKDWLADLENILKNILNVLQTNKVEEIK
jgi:transcription-repair coupling factor (superfamily II helicase)